MNKNNMSNKRTLIIDALETVYIVLTLIAYAMAIINISIEFSSNYRSSTVIIMFLSMATSIIFKEFAKAIKNE